jgi:nucleoside-diphosphate-sugar epimerase
MPHIMKRLPKCVTFRCTVSRKAQSLLGWSPKIQLREGLAKTIDYFDRYY